ncbi:MAG: alpha-amylase [Proteobacteria bacterium]|nr:alpha-amylase [Pseudomonadota bacterium]MBU4295083.1 alpha-amylase [Pseudomonadota bacterium]MCG2746563.1 hypothetical protein [Desulfobulbaceae bacterium]
MEKNEQGPRIYNLFPLLAGSIKDWQARIPTIGAMHFNWIFLNPFHYPGFSGSLYAVKDYYRLHPLFQGDGEESMEELLGGFLHHAEATGLRVMMDLVVNHTSKDSILVAEHPGWYVRDRDGQICSPFAVNPDDPEDITVWGDLAALDYSPRPERKEMIEYWQALLQYYIKLGFHGFRCDAAYQISGEVWQELISAARADKPEVLFFAETLGAKLEEVEQLHSSGFDYFFNSAKWWDFMAPWLLEQYDKFRLVAPSIAFPESHDTERLAAESGGKESVSRFWYLFCAFFSSGVMMPIGYELGYRCRLNVVNTRPADGQKGAFDIRQFIAAVNEMKAKVPVLNEEGPQECFTGEDAAVVGLLRRSTRRQQKAAALINPHREKEEYFNLEHLAAVMGCEPQDIVEITPQTEGSVIMTTDRLRLPPCSIRVFQVD